MIRRVDRLPVTVAMGVTVDAESIRKYGADAVVIAVGAEPEWPEVPGVQGPWAAWAGDVLAGRVSLGSEVVILGGGRIGCETALVRAQLGKKVTVVEEQDALAKDLNGINRPMLVRLVLEQSVQVVTSSRMLDVVESGVLVGGPDAKARWIQADNLVLAGKMKARTTLAEGIVDVTPSLYIIGDCRTPGTLLDATSDGFKAGMDI
jgi:pyruvate/2-oxoglutarate dehydrogenase complex dihydrolipoamide dehydrogenase (E3) component